MPLMNRTLSALMGVWATLVVPRRDERGGSELIGALLLIGGIIVVAALVVAGITVYVNGHLPSDG